MRALRTCGVSERKSCWLIGCPRNTLHYRSRRVQDDHALRERLEVLAAQRVRFGYRRLHVLVAREGWIVNHKRLRRIYRAAGLQVRPRKKRHVRYVRGSIITPVTRVNQRWSLDFLHDRLLTGRRIRALNIIDDHSRRNLALELDFSLSSARVILVLDEIAAERGYPGALRIDNGPELTSLALLRWAAAHDVDLQYIDRGKPVQNAHVESCNGRLRDEFFNVQGFRTLAEAQASALIYRIDYNEIRPHSALDYRTPLRFESDYKAATNSQLQVHQ